MGNDYQWWPCNTDLCQCQDAATTTGAPTTSGATTTEAATTTGAPTTTGATTTTEDETEPCSADDVTDAPTTGAPTTTETATTTQFNGDNSVIDSTRRRAQASVFGDYTQINWNQVLCSQDQSDAKPYMNANPICATAISMGSASVNTQGAKDQNGKPGFCMRTTPGIGAAKASSCWKVRCVGGDNALRVGVSCKHHNPIYLKTVDTNMENSLSLTDNAFTNQCASVYHNTNTPSCRAFDITVQAWNLMVVFSSNQGSQAGKPAGLNGIVPVEYEEVDCNDPVVQAGIQDSHCGLSSTMII